MTEQHQETEEGSATGRGVGRYHEEGVRAENKKRAFEQRHQVVLQGQETEL